MSTLSPSPEATSHPSGAARLSFAKIDEPLPIDDLDLVAIQRDSFDWLKERGLGVSQRIREIIIPRDAG